MKTILRQPSGFIPQGIDPKVADWILHNNAATAQDHKDIEDEFAKIGTVKKWTPVLTCATPGNLSVSYSTQTADLFRTRDSIIASFSVLTSAFTWSTSSGDLQISGLPYTAISDSGAFWTGSLAWDGITKTGYTQIVSAINGGTNVIAFSASGSGKTNANVSIGDTTSGGRVLLFGHVVFRIHS